VLNASECGCNDSGTGKCCAGGSLKKELEAKKKEVIKLTGERDALREAAKQKKTGSGASAKEVKELADLRQQVLQGSARDSAAGAA
jgi:hypothetical protein